MQTSTHALTIGEREVRKEFVADHEAEAEREWAFLTLLAEHAPGLAPWPLRREDAATPVIVMERLPGEPLAPRPLTIFQTAALARAYVADPPLPEPRITALGIADRNPPNVLWDGRMARLVDFEDAGLSDPAYELADHVAHLGSRLHGVYDAHALADAVGLDAEARERMSAYRPVWAAFWLVMLLPGNGAWRRNPPGTTEAHAGHFMALAARD